MNPSQKLHKDVSSRILPKNRKVQNTPEWPFPPPSGKTMKNYVTSATLYAITQCLYIYLVIII